MQEVLINHLGGLSLPRKSVVRLTDRPDMTLDVYRVRKTTTQQQQPVYFYGQLLANVLGCNGEVYLQGVEYKYLFDNNTGVYILPT